MNNNYGTGTQYPTVNLAVKKSRLKLYDNRSESPTYFLNKGQEFQIELFNPTKFILLAKIKLNGNAISGGGLVIRPGERIFLERFLEENKKFLFDTYQVDNIAAVKKAIEENGDLVVDFYKEKITPKIDPQTGHFDLTYNYQDLDKDFFIPVRGSSGTPSNFLRSGTTGNIGLINMGNSNTTTTNSVNALYTDTNISNTGPNVDSTITTTSIGNTTSDTMSYSHDLNLGNSTPESRGIMDMSATLGSVTLDSLEVPEPKTKGKRRRVQKTSDKKSKSIETGRVTKGSNSNQELTEVELDFEWDVFHSVEYKMLPTSQKRYDSKEIKQRYCGDCGKKLKPTHKFCPNCGEEQ